jgi:hypothetical protein
MPNPYGVDFEQVFKNATADGIDLNQITLFYTDLTLEEIDELKRHSLFVSASQKCVMGKFNKEGLALFPNKVSSVYSLGA